MIFIVSGVLFLFFMPLLNPSAPGQELGGAIKTRARPPAPHAILGNSACERCHKSQNEWWPENAHYKTAQPFLEKDRKREKIARLYGINPADMVKGTQICMDCHGTIITGRESEEVMDGVGCEACHGAAKEYLKPHQVGESSLGDKRPGYLKGLELGLVKLRDVNVRARRCVGCHIITESRLISAGHPTGEQFDFVDGVSYIRHWEAPVESPETLQQAFRLVLGERGRTPEPVIPRKETPPPPPPPAAVPKEAAPQTPPVVSNTPEPKGDLPPVTKTPPVPAQVPSSPPVKPGTPSRPQPSPPTVSPQPIESTPPSPPPSVMEPLVEEPSLPPRPSPKKVDASASVEEMLLSIKERLDNIERELYSGNYENR